MINVLVLSAVRYRSGAPVQLSAALWLYVGILRCGSVYRGKIAYRKRHAALCRIRDVWGSLPSRTLD